MTALKPLTAAALPKAGAPMPDRSADLAPRLTAFAKQLAQQTAELSASPMSFAFEQAGLPRKPDEGAGCAAVLLVGGEARHIIRISMDRVVVFGLCDALLGGMGNEPAFAEDRPLSKIEQSLAELLALKVGAALPAALAPQEIATFDIKAMDEQNPSDVIDLEIVFNCAVHGYSGDVRIGLPQPLAASLRSAALDASGQAASPAQPVRINVGHVPVELVAVLADVPMSLEDLSRISKGQLIPLDITSSTPVKVMSEGVELFQARLGRSARHYCVGLL
jgi:flagellar motor switch protein FliM